jgi:hypothetical protein
MDGEGWSDPNKQGYSRTRSNSTDVISLKVAKVSQVGKGKKQDQKKDPGFVSTILQKENKFGTKKLSRKPFGKSIDVNVEQRYILPSC